MKKSLLIGAILGLVLVSACATTQASEIDKRGFVSVNTNANAELAPDVAEISFAAR